LNSNGMRIEIRQRVIFKAMVRPASSKSDLHEFSKILSDHSPLEFAFVATLFEDKEGRIIRPGSSSSSGL
jgi:hypothetical protein